MARRGRRPGVSHARDDILEAARARFAAEGYAKATIRAIATEAEVDSALVHHYFGDKDTLFTAAMAIPYVPDEVITAIAGGDRSEVGRRLVTLFLATWDPDEGRDRMRALLRSAATEERVARLLREFLVEAVYRPLTDRLGSDLPDLRATAAASQMVGLAMMRYVIAVEPLASAAAEEVIDLYEPGVQHALLGRR